jgi:hypothetical protein
MAVRKEDAMKGALVVGLVVLLSALPIAAPAKDLAYSEEPSLVTLPSTTVDVPTWTNGESGSQSAPASALPRSLADRPDELSPAYLAHFVYFLPADSADESLDTNGAITTSVLAMNSWLGAKTGGRTIRVDTSGGIPDVTFFRSSQTDAQLKVGDTASNIRTEMRATGQFNSPYKRYLVYYGGHHDSYCGEALPTGWAALYLFGPSGCNSHTIALTASAPRWAEEIMLHEFVHLDALVWSTAPNYLECVPRPNVGHICDDCGGDASQDLMCQYSHDFPTDLDDGAPDPADNHVDYYLNPTGGNLHYFALLNPSLPLLSIDVPVVRPPGQPEVVPLPFQIAGWALDLSARSLTCCTGVSSVRAFALPSDAYGNVTGGPIRLPDAVEVDRADVAAVYGAQFSGSGYSIHVDSLSPGYYRLEVQALSYISGLWMETSVTVAVESDTDGIYDPYDNCPYVSNANQANLDGDSMGDACDADDDNDNVIDVFDFCPQTYDPSQADYDLDGTLGTQPPPGATVGGDACDADDDSDGYPDLAESGSPLCLGKVNDDDSDDSRVNDGCPAVGAPEIACTFAVDFDGDGYVNDGCPTQGAYSEADFRITTDSLLSCDVGLSSGPSPGWPADLVSGGVPDSTDKVTIADLVSFLAPIRRLNSDPGAAAFSGRWDLWPGRGVFNQFINVQDLSSLISVRPPMLGGQRALNGPTCHEPPFP